MQRVVKIAAAERRLCASTALKLLACLSLVWPALDLAETAWCQTDQQAAAPGDVRSAEDQDKNLELLSRENSKSEDFKDTVIPELYLLARAGEIQLERVPQLDYEWRYDDDWIRNSLRGSAENISAENITPGLFAARGFIAGVAGSINEESNAAIAANRILWNIRSTFWSQSLIDADLNLAWLKEGNKLGQVQFNWRRAYIQQLITQDKTRQLFRESLKVTGPKTLVPLTFLTFRFLGAEEDFLWLYSPATKKVRQLTSANRTDPLFRSDVALDDLMLWSGKPELVDARIDRNVRALAAFPSVRMATLAKAADREGCVEVNQNAEAAGTARLGRWPYEAPGVEGGAASGATAALPPARGLFMFPAGAVFTLRDLWRIELTSRDPYTLYGRQVLYVDPVMMLPLYKVVFDLSGRLWKVAVGAFGLAAEESEKGARNGKARRAPFPAFTVVVDLVKRQTTVIDYTRISYCGGFNETVKLADFDPYKLAPPAEEGEAGENDSLPAKGKKAVDKKQPEPAEVDER